MISLLRPRHQRQDPGGSSTRLAYTPTSRPVLCTEDRLFPPEFMRRVVADRLGVVPDEISAGHTVALSCPKELAGLLAWAHAQRRHPRSTHYWEILRR
jgi:hypothetical protein